MDICTHTKFVEDCSIPLAGTTVRKAGEEGKHRDKLNHDASNRGVS